MPANDLKGFTHGVLEPLVGIMRSMILEVGRGRIEREIQLKVVADTQVIQDVAADYPESAIAGNTRQGGERRGPELLFWQKSVSSA